MAKVWARLGPTPLALAGSLLALFLAAPPTEAFKPYTHVYVADQAAADMLDDGHVTINGQEYPVDPAILAAVTQYRSYYNAGVIGPDGFPDLTMGQSIIHPEDTGEWLRFILEQAWAAQTDPQYTVAERGQILAFSYGFLTHAAGDMWAHTMVNYFAREVFPPVGEIVTNPDSAAVALRHIMVEGYIGDATPGYDGNPNRTQLPDGDWSDSSTPGISYNAPHKFIYNTLVRRGNGSPSDERGPLLNYFYSLRATLVDNLNDPDPDPLEAAISSFDGTRDALNDLVCDCNFGDNSTGCLGADPSDLDIAADVLADLVLCPAGLLELGFTVVIESFEAFLNFTGEAIALAFDAMVDAYMAAWIDDIDEGMRHWSELGLATTQALFDPQARRDAQNDEFGSYGPDGQEPRNSAEDGMGIVDVVFYKADPFINDHLISMLGAPDFVGELRDILAEAADFLDTILGPYLNPLRYVNQVISDFAKDLLFDFIKERYGFDIEAMKEFFDSPSSKMDITTVQLYKPGGGTVDVELFRADDHETLDLYLGMDPTHHDGPGGGLADNDIFNHNTFAAYRNAVMTSKLLLLGGGTLDQVLSDLVGLPVSYYTAGPEENIMTTPLPGVGSPNQWLRSIDADHAWRADSRPVFPESSHPLAGEGNFPLWESCVLRESAFRALFVDWENGAANFPDLFDEPSFDPNDPNPPVSTLVIEGPSYSAMGNVYIAGATELKIAGGDDFWPVDSIEVATEIRADGELSGVTGTYAIGDSLDLEGYADGRYHVDLSASDPCRVETEHTLTYVFDTTPPVVTFTEPALAQYDTDDLATISFTIDDGPLGSGVMSSYVTLDGQLAVNGQSMDFFFFEPGEHVITVVATDNLGNTGSTDRTFIVRATSESLLSNLDRAFELGLITGAGNLNSMKSKVEAALRSHQAGRHETEWKQLNALANELSAQMDKAVDEETAERLIAFVLDLINSQEAGSPMNAAVNMDGGVYGSR